jgi:hypothetical protein
MSRSSETETGWKVGTSANPYKCKKSFSEKVDFNILKVIEVPD